MTLPSLANGFWEPSKSIHDGLYGGAGASVWLRERLRRLSTT